MSIHIKNINMSEHKKQRITHDDTNEVQFELKQIGEDEDEPHSDNLYQAYQPVSMAQIKMELEKSDEECWGCKFGFGVPNCGYEKVKDLYNFFMDNKGGLTDAQLAEKTHTLFERDIRQPMLAKGKPCIEWPIHLIDIHTRIHMIVEPRPVMTTLRTDVNIAYNKLSNMWLIRDESGKEDVHEKRFKMWCDIVKLKVSLYKEDPDKLKR